jgi:hypothetical protein
MINVTKVFVVSAIALVICISHQVSFAQEDAKSIHSEDLIKKRPTGKVQKNNATVATTSRGRVSANRKKRLYRLVRPSRTAHSVIQSKTLQKEFDESLLGLTVWKIRPATKDDTAKELVEEGQGRNIQSSEHTLERMGLDTPLVIGERIRLSVESLSHSGYLYVVERELYSDGTYSIPKLIYPTLRTKNGNKLIGAGDLIFVPEGPRYFRVTSNQTQKTQIGEVLSIIISPNVLVEQSALQIKAIDLPPERFAAWLKQWEVDAALLEQIDGEGQPITVIEQSAGQDAAKGLTEESADLTQDDPTPQSIFRSRVKRGNPLLTNIYLKFRSN